MVGVLGTCDRAINNCSKDFYTEVRNFLSEDFIALILNDLFFECGCPVAFLDTENKFYYSKGWTKKDKIDKEFCEKNDLLISDIVDLISRRSDNCIEISYGDKYTGVWIPVTVRQEIVGFFILGQFVLKSLSFSSKLIGFTAIGAKLMKKQHESYVFFSKDQIEKNIQRCLNYVSVISRQLQTKLDLSAEIKKNQEVANQLLVQKAFFENLFNNSHEAIAILDNEDKIIQINHEFEKLFGYLQHEAAGLQINDLIVPENFKEEGLVATRDVSIGKPIDLTTVRKTKCGKLINIQVTGKPIVLENNQIAVYAVYRNLTEQSWAQETQKIIYKISEIINSPHSTFEIIEKIGAVLKQIIGSGEVSLDLRIPKKRTLRVYNDESHVVQEVLFSNSLSSVVIIKKKLQYLNEQQILQVISENQLQLLQIPKTWLGFPLFSDGTILGVFVVSFKYNLGELNLDRIKLLEVISGQIASGITKRIKNTEIKMLYQAIEQSPSSIVITDLSGDIQYVNSKFCEITGYSYKEAIGKNPRILKSGYTPTEKYEELWNSILSGEEWCGEFLNVKKNKELYWERARISGIKDDNGEIINIVGVKEDITDYKKFEKRLLEAKNRAEESDRLKSSFLANMSHELRTPLNAVIGFSNLCDESLPVSEILEFTRYINKSGNQLLSIVEDILNFASMESGNMQIRKDEFFLENLVTEVKKIALEKQIEESKEHLELIFSLDLGYSQILVRSDYQRLLQVVINLIKNGFKFTIDGFVEIGFRIEEEKLIIYVKDSGIGIEEAKKDIIFQHFRQSDDSLKRLHGGTGLGLAISKKIMDMLGGSIEVESELNSGSVFTLKLDCVISKEKKMSKRMVNGYKQLMDL